MEQKYVSASKVINANTASNTASNTAHNTHTHTQHKHRYYQT